MVRHRSDAGRSRSTNGDRGASLVEYALLVALIALVCFSAVVFLGDSTSSEFESHGSSLFES